MNFLDATFMLGLRAIPSGATHKKSQSVSVFHWLFYFFSINGSEINF